MKQKMINQIIVIILILTNTLIYGQSFEGTINYKVNIGIELPEYAKKMGLTKDLIIQKMKTEGTWSDSLVIKYKKGNYILYTNFNPLSFSIYKSESNKIYSFQDSKGQQDLCTVTDASIDLESQMFGVKPIVVKLDSFAYVSGFRCEIVQVKWRTGTYNYYYSSSILKIDPQLFKEHIYDGWARFLEISKALPIRIEKVVNGLSITTITLTKYKEERIDDNLFVIPKLLEDNDLNFIKKNNREIMRILK